MPRAAGVAAKFVRTERAGVPSPGQAQMPGPAVRTEQRTERAELEPADVQLAGVFGSRDEAADVGAPVRNAREACVDRDRHVRLQRLPRRVDVTRPQERAVALHAGVAVAVQRERPLVRTIELRSFPIHADAGEPRPAVQAIALIRPPAVDAEVHRRLVIRPVAFDGAILGPAVVRRASARDSLVGRAGSGNGATHAPAFDHRVQHDLVVQRVEIVDGLLRIREVLLLPPELAVACVPSRRRELRAEIDQPVARQLLLAERLRDPHHLVWARQGSMRLQVTERPQRRQLRASGDARVFAEDDLGIRRRHDEDVERQRLGGRSQPALGAR